ncbi:MAG: DUF2794 domain-containing protein [Pseudomonadota bacterium]
MSDSEPIQLRPRGPDTRTRQTPDPSNPQPVPQRGPSPEPKRATFTRQELNAILNVYGRKVAAGEWKDYALDFERETATFSVFRRASEMPIYRIEKTPKLARRQGAYSVVSQTGHILKRGHDLARVLAVLDKRLRLVE